jgi:hypothetical protein
MSSERMHWNAGIFLNSDSVQTCCHDVQTDATVNCSKLLDIDGSSDGIATSSRRNLLTDERPDGILGFDFSELESAQNLSGTSEIAFFILVRLNLS